MSGTRIVILSSGSIFVEGVARRLREQMTAIDFLTISSGQAAALQEVVAAQPAVVIADAADSRLEQFCPLTSLLAAHSQLTVIRLEPQHERMQVITSEHRAGGGMSSLIRTIQSVIG